MTPHSLLRAALAASIPALSYAAEEAGHGEPDLTPSKWIHFGLLLALLVYGWFKAVAPGLKSRAAQILADLDQARRSQAESQARVAALQGRLGNLETEIASFQAESRHLIAQEGARIEQETADLLARLQARTQQEIASLAKHTRSELRAEVTRLAAGMAAEQLRNTLDREAHGRLVTAFAADLKSARGQNSVGDQN